MTDTKDMSASEWWGKRRARYNIGLLIAGLLAFVAYATKAFVGVGVSFFTAIYLVVSFLSTLAVANILYFFAPIFEKILKPGNVKTYRNITYNLGFWLFALILFVSPLLVGYVFVVGGRGSA